MQVGFYFDQTRCIGCDTCVVACKDYNNIPTGINWNRVSTIESGDGYPPFVAFLVMQCYHCITPACLKACPVDAIVKRQEDGIVIVDKEKCQGYDSCGSCLEACPYNVPVFKGRDAKMEKCDFCIDRLITNKKPICVDSCPTRALDAGNIEDLRIKYGDINEASGFIYSVETESCIVFKPKNSLDKL